MSPKRIKDESKKLKEETIKLQKHIFVERHFVESSITQVMLWLYSKERQED